MLILQFKIIFCFAQNILILNLFFSFRWIQILQFLLFLIKVSTFYLFLYKVLIWYGLWVEVKIGYH